MRKTKASFDDNGLLKYLPKRIDKNKITKIIGSGTEGIIFSYDKNKILKLNLDPRSSFNKFKKVCNYFKNNPHANVMRVYDFGKIKNPLSNKNKYIFWLIGEKLNPLSPEEECSLNMNYDSYHKFIDSGKFKIVNSNIKKIDNFIKKIILLPFKHGDFFHKNVMKNKKTYKIIDLEGFGE